MARKHPARHLHADVPVILPPVVRELLGPEAAALVDALKGPSPVSIRLNPLKPAPLHGAPVPWCGSGRYLDERPVFTLDPCFHAGAYYVQEASSMLLEQAWKACGPFPPDTVALDLCAAPGGKSTHLAALLPEEALLVCNEPVRARQGALMENLWKWGRADVIITGSLPGAFLPLGAFFDLIVVDAPCSGEGMFRKDAFARAQWNEKLVEHCAILQREILEVAWELLRPGGHLIYSTCTWEKRENEEHIQRLIEGGAEFVPIPVHPSWGMEESGSGLRCYPHRVRGEGFFMAALRKPGEREGHASHERSQGRMQGRISEWLKNAAGMTLLEDIPQVHALSARWSGHLRSMGSTLRMLAPGIPVALRKGNEWVPHPALALNALLDRAVFPALDLDHQQALAYLRGEALPATDAVGRALVCHRGMALGWATGAGNRWNNGSPTAWRIRMR
jgi:16S rRNA C967 or C1407 C5-methylase (RsmB/RsmF family)/NOL1/NOP2/fmu family ribosome biogenesis protein